MHGRTMQILFVFLAACASTYVVKPIVNAGNLPAFSATHRVANGANDTNEPKEDSYSMERRRQVVAHHPHAGARDQNGAPGYKANVRALANRLDDAVPPGIVSDCILQRNGTIGECVDELCDSMETRKWISGQQESKAQWEYFRQKLKPNHSDKPDRPKILCLVYTHGSSKARGKLSAIVDTWGRHCDGFLAASTETDPTLGAVDIPHQGKEDYHNMWQKVRSMLAYAADYYLDEFDCFHNCGDDTFVVIENLQETCRRSMIASQDHPFYAGSWNPWNDFQRVFAGGGPGYTLNKVALRALVDSFPDCLAEAKSSTEDVYVGECFGRLNITVNDTLDELGEQRYLDGGFATIQPIYDASTPKNRTLPWRQNIHRWRKEVLGWKMGDGIDAASSSAVAFHRFGGNDLRRYYAMVYRTCPTGTALGDASVGIETSPLDEEIEFDPECSSIAVQRNRFALFSYNFGGYRNEVDGLKAIMSEIANIGIDCYFFTDNANFTNVPPLWTVIHVPSLGDNNGIPGNKLASKDLKFRFHPILDKYQYWVHVDSKHSRLRQMSKLLNAGLLRHVVGQPLKALFIQKHEVRSTVQQEIDQLKKMPHLQPLAPLMEWEKFLKPDSEKLSQVPLATLKIWIINSHHRPFLDAWNQIYNIIVDHGLWRDQIVYSYAVKSFMDDIEYFEEEDLPKDCRPIVIS